MKYYIYIYLSHCIQSPPPLYNRTQKAFCADLL